MSDNKFITRDLKIALLQIYGGDIDRAQAAFMWVEGDEQAPAPKAKPAVAGETPKAAPKAAAKPAEAKPAGLDYNKDVAAKITKLVQACGNDQAVAIGVLKAFGVKSAKQIPEDQWPAFIEAVDAAIVEQTGGDLA